MNCEDIVCKLHIIEDDPITIWRTMQRYYGYGFFNVMIEREFGINPLTHEETTKKFMGEVANVEETMKESLNKVNEKMEIEYEKIKEEIQGYKDQIRKLDDENSENIIYYKSNLDKVGLI